MKIEDIIEATGGLGDDARIATAKLIDIKVESEMKQLLVDIRNEFKALDSRFDKIDTRFVDVGNEFKALDSRFEQIDTRFEQVRNEFKALDTRFEQVSVDVRNEFKTLDSRFDKIDTRFEQVDLKLEHMNEKFVIVYWLIGFVGVFLTLLLTILSVFPKLSS